MRAAPSVSSRVPDAVSDQRTRRPARSEASRPSAAVRASACRADFDSTPSPPSTSRSTWVHTGSSRGSTNSPSTVSSSDRALVAPSSRRRDRAGCGSTARELARTAADMAVLSLTCRSPDLGRLASASTARGPRSLLLADGPGARVAPVRADAGAGAAAGRRVRRRGAAAARRRARAGRRHVVVVGGDPRLPPPGARRRRARPARRDEPRDVRRAHPRARRSSWPGCSSRSPPAGLRARLPRRLRLGVGRGRDQDVPAVPALPRHGRASTGC